MQYTRQFSKSSQCYLSILPLLRPAAPSPLVQTKPSTEFRLKQASPGIGTNAPDCFCTQSRQLLIHASCWPKYASRLHSAIGGIVAVGGTTGCAAWLLLLLSLHSGAFAQKRAVTVADSIQAASFGTPLDEALSNSPEIFSPKHDEFVVITRKGIIASNVNRYTLPGSGHHGGLR